MLNDALEMSLALSPERDNNFFTGGLSALYESRTSWDRKKVFAEALRAWRVNPIARRIVRLMTSFVIGKGITITANDPKTQTFLSEWWSHPLNQIGRNAKRWKDEDTRTGNLFFLCTVDEAGMTYIRAMPAEQIEEIETKENDIEQETRYTKDAVGAESYEAYNPDAEQKTFMLHYASNKPIGAAWGEADLSPLLVWIGRFSSWLEDRVRLNRFRTAFMYVIRGAYASEAERAAREKQLKANPPQPGSILVLNSQSGEEWGILSSQLDAFDASTDGLAIKKNIASGIGFPLHWLAEPESATRTTAEAAGTPTFRTLEEAQDDFFSTLVSLAQVACQVRSRFDKSIDPKTNITIEGPDITERDNATLALALGRAYPQLADLYDREGIDAKEFLRLVYKMFAEVWDWQDETIPKIKRKPLTQEQPQAPGIEEEDEPSDPEEQSNSLTNQLANAFQAIANKEPAKLSITNNMPAVSVPVQIENNMPEQPAPVTKLEMPVTIENQIEQPAINIENNMPEQPAPVTNIHNQIEQPEVTIKNQVQPAPVKVLPAAFGQNKPSNDLETEPVLPKARRRRK